MKIILAPDSFKGTMTSKEVIDIMKSKLYGIDIIEIPIADGGEGTLDTIIDILGGDKIQCKVHNPLMKRITSYIGVFGDTAVIEMALASGITLLDASERNPILTSTYGSGELILEALNRGVSKIVIGIGGSATNDGGIGMASALGVKFLDKNNNEVITNGMYLNQIHSIDISDIDKRIYNTEIEVMCDVNNPFTGKLGASNVYSPQKGASKEMQVFLEKGMLNLLEVIKRDFKLDLNDIEGSGAAGGLGGGTYAFLNAKLRSGIDSIIDLTNLKKHIRTSDFIITGEGKFDEQSLQGKVVSGILNSIKNTNCKAIIVAGYSEIKNIKDVYIVSTTDKKYDEKYLKEHAKDNLSRTMDEVFNYIRSLNE